MTPSIQIIKDIEPKSTPIANLPPAVAKIPDKCKVLHLLNKANLEVMSKENPAVLLVALPMQL